MDDLGKWVSLLAAGMVSCALFMLLHAMNWRRIFGDEWTRPPRSYIAGIVGLAIPFTALMALWGDWWAVGGAASVVIGGGAPVLYGYYVRGIARRDESPQYFTPEEYEAFISVHREQIAALEQQLMLARGELERCKKEKGRPSP